MFIQTNFNGRSAGGGIGCLFMGVLGLVAAFYIVKGVFAVLWWAAPFLFLLTLLINWRVVAEAGKGLVKLFRRQPLSGLILTVLAAVAFPITALFLFLSALGSRRPADSAGASSGRKTEPAEPVEGEFIDFEEIESRPKTPLSGEKPLEPPRPAEKQASKNPENPYDELFNTPT